MYRREKHEKAEIILLGIAAVFVISSLAFLVISVTRSNNLTVLETQKVEAAVLPTQTQPIKAEVFGVNTKNDCADEAEYKERILDARPRVLVYVGTTAHEMKTSVLLSCAKFKPISGQASCQKQDVIFDRKCVLSEVQKTAFFEPQEVITSPDRTRRTEVRIADGSVDKEKLAELLVTQLPIEFRYELITSLYITRKEVVLEAPTNNKLPNTTGNYASRYIEVDGSRQLLFLWEGGRFKTFRTSGSFPEYNPVGIHTILNKSPNAWSSTANKWMPYWMAFAYDKSQRAWLGFHALVYWYPGYQKEGIKKIYEPESNIGTPRSTGCIRMTKSDSSYLYEWARVGDVVIIHD